MTLKQTINALEKERARRRMSLEEWADELQVNLSTYTKWKYGQHSPMAATLFHMLARAGLEVRLRRKEAQADE